MEEAARRFARRILLLHLLLLTAVVLLVMAGAREVYNLTRQEVLQQAIQRQELLTAQTAGAIEDHYQAILSDLLFAKQAEHSEYMPDWSPQTVMQMARILWTQIDDRATQLFLVRTDTSQIVFSLPEGSAERAGAVTEIAADWLKQLDQPSISPFLILDTGGVNLVALPLAEHHALVAVVPVDLIEERFLDAINTRPTLSATLLDSEGRTMSTADSTLVGGNVFQQIQDRSITSLLESYMADPTLRTQVFEEALDLGELTLPPRMVTAHPIPAGDTSWVILMASHLTEVDDIIQGVFRRTLVWAIFLVVSVTGILVSTATLLIRGRSRLERLEHEMLTRELNQAREIQLAWLPKSGYTTATIKIEALNKPANHISGDFYDWFSLPDGRMVVTIGDVTGHGMSAAFLMSTTQLLIRNTMLRVLDPARCLREVNAQLCSQVFIGQFVTMLICVIDVDHGTLATAIAGHFPPLIGNPRDGFTSLKVQPQLVLGIEPDVPFKTEYFDLPPEADLVLYTDGVVEAANPGGDRFGVENLQACLSGPLNHPQQVIERITNAVNEFRGGRELDDDLTIVAVRLQAHPAGTRRKSPQTAVI